MSEDNNTSVRFRTIVLNMPNGRWVQFGVDLGTGYLEPIEEGQPALTGELTVRLDSFIRKQHYLRKLLRKNKTKVCVKYKYTLNIKTGEVIIVSDDDVGLKSDIKIGKKLKRLFTNVKMVAYSLEAHASRTNGHRRKAKTSR